MPIALEQRAARPNARRRRQPAETPSSITEDWHTYKQTGSVASRNRLVAYYMAGHVRPIAVRVRAGLPQQVDLDDLIQQGYLGLIDAMDRFDIDREIRFEAFSRTRIFGAIQDYLRSIDPVPRLTRSRSKRLQAVLEDFRKRHGREPTDDELRPVLNVTEPAFQRFLADRRPAATVPFSNVHPDGEGAENPDGDVMASFEDHTEPGPVPIAERNDLRKWLTRGFDHRDRLVIILYYYEHLTMREIGNALGISESRVSQRLESILACLRSRLIDAGAEKEFVFA